MQVAKPGRRADPYRSAILSSIEAVNATYGALYTDAGEEGGFHASFTMHADYDENLKPIFAAMEISKADCSMGISHINNVQNGSERRHGRICDAKPLLWHIIK